MRTSVFLTLLSSLTLFCTTWAADIPLKDFNSSTDLVSLHSHILDKSKAEKDLNDESYVTGDPHKDHDMSSSTMDHKHHTIEYQNSEPEVLEFFRASSEGDVYKENPDNKHDMHSMHVHHMKSSDAVDKPVLYSTPKESSYMDDPMGGGHEAHSMEDMGGHGSHEGHDHHNKMNMSDTGSMDHMMMMMMYFHTGVNEVILFKQWKISTVGGLLGSMVGIFLLALIYEGLKYLREHLFKKYVSSIQFSTVAVTGESGRVTQVHKLERHHMMSWPHALQTLLHVVQIVLSYFLMLIFMTYNVWLCLAVVLGAGFGYFIFGWKKATVVDITEHCH